MNNNNQKLIEGLRAAADYFESRPDLPIFPEQAISLWTWRDLDKLGEVARKLGSFRKEFDEDYLHLKVDINEAVVIRVVANREAVCTKIVTWNCPDEGLMKLLAPSEEDQ